MSIISTFLWTEKFIIKRIQNSSSLMLLSIICLFFSYLPLRAQTIVPAGLGPMSSTQPDRETAVLSGNLLRTGGQNPTVKIVWGDEDGEVTGKSWDNTVVISTNQGVGSFSTTITIPNQEKIYYFARLPKMRGGRWFHARSAYSIHLLLLGLLICGGVGPLMIVISRYPILCHPLKSQVFNSGWMLLTLPLFLIVLI
jgi:hypothetical protein